jgi:hypothetical protein
LNAGIEAGALSLIEPCPPDIADGLYRGIVVHFCETASISDLDYDQSALLSAVVRAYRMTEASGVCLPPKPYSIGSVDAGLLQTVLASVRFDAYQHIKDLDGFIGFTEKEYEGGVGFNITDNRSLVRTITNICDTNVAAQSCKSLQQRMALQSLIPLQLLRNDFERKYLQYSDILKAINKQSDKDSVSGTSSESEDDGTGDFTMTDGVDDMEIDESVSTKYNTSN